MTAAYHSIHEPDEGPESDCVILHDGVNWCKEIAHSLYIAKIWTEFIICQQHVLHLLQMHIGADIHEWGVGVGVRNVLAREERDGAICAMNILLCNHVLVAAILIILLDRTYPVLLFFPVIKLLWA